MKRLAMISTALILGALILAACGGVPLPGNASNSGGRDALPPAQPTIARSSADANKGVAPSAPAAAPAPSLGASAPPLATPVAGGATLDRLIIRNGSIVLVVKDVAARMEEVGAIARNAGGLVQSSSSRHQDDALYATVVIKVPAESFDDVVARLSDLAVKVDSENTSTQDVTEEYVDLNARVKVLEATEQQLLTFLERTQNVDESLKVYRELTNVRSQIEQIKGRMNYLQKSAAMSTITVQLRPEEKEKPIVEEEGWNPGRVARTALRSLVQALQGLLNLIIWVILFFGPVIVVVGVLAFVLLAVWRRLRPPRPAR